MMQLLKQRTRLNIKVTGHVGPYVKLDKALAAHQQIEHFDEFIETLLPDTSINHGRSVFRLWYLGSGKMRGLLWRYVDESRLMNWLKK